MQGWAKSLKWFAYLTILLIAVAIGYAGLTALRYWPAISV